MKKLKSLIRREGKTKEKPDWRQQIEESNQKAKSEGRLAEWPDPDKTQVIFFRKTPKYPVRKNLFQEEKPKPNQGWDQLKQELKSQGQSGEWPEPDKTQVIFFRNKPKYPKKAQQKLPERITSQNTQKEKSNKILNSKTTEINKFVVQLANYSVKPILENEIWQVFGYSKRQVVGNLWTKTFPKKYELMDYITKVILMMGLIDVLNGIKQAAIPDKKKLLLSIGVLGIFLSTIEQIFETSTFMEDLFSTYNTYLESDKEQVHVPFILKAKDILNKQDFAKFMVGTISLLGTSSHGDGYLLSSAVISQHIKETKITGELTTPNIPLETRNKYLDLLSNIIINNN